MKKRTKVMLTVLCAALLVAASVMGTMAYLTSKDNVQNTFTVGKLAITLDEADTNELGEKLYVPDTTTLMPRVKANEYKLIPGRTYVKDPTVHVAPGSEASYVFVRVQNGLADLPVTLTMAAGWNKLGTLENIYYQKVDAVGTTAEDLLVFDQFTVPTTVTNEQLNDGYKDAKITVEAFACQQDTFDTALAAWDASFADK